jgi:hypothetical protein
VDVQSNCCLVERVSKESIRGFDNLSWTGWVGASTETALDSTERPASSSVTQLVVQQDFGHVPIAVDAASSRGARISGWHRHACRAGLGAPVIARSPTVTRPH